jgi:uncharacterized protein YbjT (DUF2867 family)
MKIAVTGATGYIGTRFIQRCIAAGHEIVALSRHSPILPNCKWMPYELSSNNAINLPLDTKIIIHLATNTTQTLEVNNVQDIKAAETLVETAKIINARIIFISSQTARADAPTAYGRTKWSIEQLILASGGSVVRPGQVYGGACSGLFGELMKLTKNVAVLPAFIPAPKVQPIHIDDLVRALLKICQFSVIPSKVFQLATSPPISFTEFLNGIARDRLRTRRYFIPTPTFLLLTSLKLIGKHTQATRLNSLFNLPEMNTAPDLELLGITLRSLSSGMHISGNANRRRILFEGKSLLAYILRDKPNLPALLRYVRTIEKLRASKPLGLSKFTALFPSSIGFIDNTRNSHISWQK